jgi:hypothetical protein
MPLVIGLLRNDSNMTILVGEHKHITTESRMHDYVVMDVTAALVMNN